MADIAACSGSVSAAHQVASEVDFLLKPFTNSDRTELAGRFPEVNLRWYAASKLRTDPLYAAVSAALEQAPALPLLDLGCGMGLFAFYLRHRGFEPPILGIDFDACKIKSGQRIAQAHYAGVTLRTADARDSLPRTSGHVTLLDILQYSTRREQEELLHQAAGCVAPGGRLIVRSGLRDKSWRFGMTLGGDMFAKACFWMKASPVHYPSANQLAKILKSEGLTGEISPCWGNTPFNNYLAVFAK